jgi:rhamnopyranosyl-N-acetylglucosaminyl-diphospho-decaprenol beta-1,3/1,4-galactofuranosyltransferase
VKSRSYDYQQTLREATNKAVVRYHRDGVGGEIERVQAPETRQLSRAAIVVTYNRQRLLVECLEALAGQNSGLEIIVVDNASLDGTRAWMEDRLRSQDRRVHYLRARTNLGGAGGFAAGLAYGLERGWDWFWLMDDDALPAANALEKILEIEPASDSVYCSAAVNGTDEGRLCWPVELTPPSRRHFVQDRGALGVLTEVTFAPFLGFFVHRNLLEECGLPDGDLFVNGEDSEFSQRIRGSGRKIFLVRDSLVHHPPCGAKVRRVGNHRFVYRVMPARKRYYEIRNKILIAKRHYPHKLWSAAIPGIIARLVITLLHEGDGVGQLRAYWRGIVDGLRGRGGKVDLFGP